ncbi:MAG TPA: transglutaminase domain-containing protein [Solirubrobacteraceae bacterium]|nr:transglutaminase domain-containing protein [Solirubrobacteraceae bacterium]
MSTNTQVAVMPPVGREAGPRHRGAEAASDRPLIRLAAFGALGLYGVLRWGTMMTPAPTWRLLGLLAVALVLAAVAPVLLERERTVAALQGRGEPLTVVGGPLVLIAILVTIPIAGVPLLWTVHLRVAATANGIGEGLSALPGILVPYNGTDQWVMTVILLGAAVLLLDAALLLAFAPPALGDVRRAGAALPLIALVVVPATLVHPSFPYLQGLLLFGLIVLFMWGERVPPGRRGGVLAACAATGVIGLIVAPGLDQHSPWIDYEALTRGVSPAHAERFDWAQRYGPLVWPRTGNTVLEVHSAPKAFTGEYWKTENLDTFDGVGWADGGGVDGAPLPGVEANTIRRYTQNLTVTIRAMTTTQVIAAGDAQPPQHLSGTAMPGDSAGTWRSTAKLGPGASYTVRVYTPHPSAAKLGRTGTNYPAEIAESDLALTMPQNPPADGVAAQKVVFPSFGRHATPVDQTDPTSFTGAAAVRSSPYSQVYTLAESLAHKSKTPYAFAERVLNYLTPANGFTYDEFPPLTADPLATFLLVNRLGYCQQFAGAMALMLRMGGVPARVSTGFTTGTYDSGTKQWLVSDVDAHAWVEAWFPHYGWVTFDPTPAAAPARGGRAPISSSGNVLGSGQFPTSVRRSASAARTSSGASATHATSSGSLFLPVALAVIAAVLLASFVGWRRTAPLGPDGLLREFERALARSGRPISDGVTLATVERRLRTSPEAAAYVRRLSAARFGGATELPTLAQRRALRAQLRAGLGIVGAVRALWALPPRPHRALKGRRRGRGSPPGAD